MPFSLIHRPYFDVITSAAFPTLSPCVLRYDVMARDLDYILHSLATASADAPAFCDSGTGTGASWETLASIPCRSTEWLTAHPFAPPQGASLFLRWLRILERIQGADPKVSASNLRQRLGDTSSNALPYMCLRTLSPRFSANPLIHEHLCFVPPILLGSLDTHARRARTAQVVAGF